MAKYYIVDTYTRISLKSSTPKFEANALSTRRNAHAHWYGKAHQILLIIAASIKKARASVHACALARVFTARTHKECVHTHAHTCMHTCAYILCVYEQWRLWPVCARVHTCMGLLYGRCMGLLYGRCAVCTHAHTGQSLHCSYTQRMCAHLCMQVCKHVHTFFVCMSSEDSGQCAHMCTYWPRSSLLLHTKNVCTHVLTLACTHVHTFFVCMSSEDSDQCAHVCTLAWVFFMDAAWAFFMDAAWYARMRTLARVFTARTHKERVHICACKCAQMFTHSLCVRAVKTFASVRTCAHTGQSLHCSYTQRMDLDEHSWHNWGIWPH